MKEFKDGQKCEIEDCDNDAVGLAAGRNCVVKSVCELHSALLSDQGYPEYLAVCPNCGCQFGVN